MLSVIDKKTKQGVHQVLSLLSRHIFIQYYIKHLEFLNFILHAPSIIVENTRIGHI